MNMFTYLVKLAPLRSLSGDMREIFVRQHVNVLS